MKKYGMGDRSNVGDVAVELVVPFLMEQNDILKVENVEDIQFFREKDIDLIYVRKDGVWNLIEVKGDTQHKTGNFFFETISNESKNTPGCFMYTEANWIFYCFVEIGRLYVLPMPETRKWFEEKIKNNPDVFKKRKTSTNCGNGNSYNTVGYLVPIRMVRKEVPGCQVRDL